MQTQSIEAIRELRTRMAAESAMLKKLWSEFEDAYSKKRAQRAINDAAEADIMFLQPIEKESWRDANQELTVIGYAEMIFQMAVTHRKQLEEVMAKYGPTAVAFPHPTDRPLFS
jgi:hypothetical protein